MKSGSRSGRFMIELMMYIVLSVFLMSVLSRLSGSIIVDYRKNITFLKHTDYAYHAFELLKVDFYTHTESFALVGDVLHITKNDYIIGKEIILKQRDHRLVYQYGTTIQEVCHDLVDVKMSLTGDVLVIELIFSDVSYERGFDIGT